MLEIPESFKSEADMQAFIFQFFWNNYPHTRRMIFHVPNGGSRNKIEAVQLRAQGVVKGIPDLLILGQNGMIGLELKIPGGVVSPDQIKVHQAWDSNGYKVHVCWSAKEAIHTIAQQFSINLSLQHAI